MPLVAFIRHAPTTWNESGRLQGQTDTPLSEAGRAALATWRVPAEYLEADWVCSPLQRCRETARHLAGREVPTDPLLMEMSWGDWQGETLEGLRTSEPEEMARREALGWDFRPPGGESPRDAAARLNTFLANLKGRETPTVIVTHRGVIRTAFAQALDWDFLGKPPFKMKRAALQLFWLEPDSTLTLREANVPFEGAVGE